MTKDGDKRLNSELKTGISDYTNAGAGIKSHQVEFDSTENIPSNKLTDIQITEHTEPGIDKTPDETNDTKTSTTVVISRAKGGSTTSSSDSSNQQNDNPKVNSSSVFLNI